MSEHYEVVVIGGGIHGVGVAQAAAAAGYTVLVLEQHSLAYGTSSRSSKLVHGGLRYLESRQFGLVRESLAERHLLLRLAPDLVKLQPFYIPVYKDTSRRSWQFRAGLSLYALLGGLKPAARFRTVPSAQWPELDGLRSDGLRQVYQYYDAQTDDAALTRAVMHSAQELGAVLREGAYVSSIVLHEQGVELSYQTQGSVHQCQAKVVINAAGPWVNEVLQGVLPQQQMLGMELVQGTHVLLEGELQKGIYYLEAPQDRRAIFVIPWKGGVMIGTTETPYHGDPEAVVPLAEEQQYLLEVLQHYFPHWQPVVTNAFAGLRVLPAADDAAFHRARDTRLHADRTKQPRLITLYGGKLTTYRITAEKVLAMLNTSLPGRKPYARTSELHLSPAP